MKNKKLQINNRIIKGKVFWIVLVLAAVLLCVGSLLAMKMTELLHAYMENEVTQQALLLAELEEEKMNQEIESLNAMVSYLDEESLINRKLPVQQEGVHIGVLQLDGTALNGEELSAKQYPAIVSAFRGNADVCYDKEGGMVFAVPILHGMNVRYVLYRRYEPMVLNSRFGMEVYDNQASILLTDHEQIILSNQQKDDLGQKVTDLLDNPEVQEVMKVIEDQMNIAAAAAKYSKVDGVKRFFFTAEVGNMGLFVVGMVPEAVVASGTAYIVTLVLWVFGLLLLIFMVGVIYLFGAEEKARESEELREAKLTAEKANRAKSEFLASMSHEIRTPINAIMGMNEMVIREAAEPAVIEYAQNIQNASQNLLALINDILDFSKIESGKMELVEGDYYLSSFLNNITNMIGIRAEGKQLAFKVEVNHLIPDKLYGDETRIRQIMINLLNNAVKYTKEGSVTFYVDYEQRESDRIDLICRVKDTGIGIREEDKDKLFQKFQRLELKKNQNVEGTGLGLAITMRLVQLMGGELTVDSVYGEGSEFKVRLPQRVVDSEPIGDFEQKYKKFLAGKQNYQESFRAPDAKVLVVDDNRMNLIVVQKLLKKTEVQITTAMSGSACLEKLAEEQYDVVLLDHMMPEMDGIETLHAAREMENNQSKNAAFIALTANAIVGAEEMYRSEGFDDYLSKPIDPKALEELLWKYIGSEK